MDMSSSHHEAKSSAFQSFTTMERIQQLNAIDKSVTELLKSAGLALQTLASSKENAATPLPARRAIFEATSNSYFENLQTVDVGLQRQVLGLEEAEITTVGKKEAQADGQSGEGKLGNLDIGWLNSRSVIVDRNMEAELWQRARIFLGNLTERTGNDPGLGDTDGGDDRIKTVHS